MTGFGQATESGGPQVEVRSVNQRALEIILRLPRAYGHCEDAIRALVRGSIRRGRVEVLISDDPQPAPRQVHVDMDLAAAYDKALRDLCAQLQWPVPSDAGLLLQLPGVCELRAATAAAVDQAGIVGAVAVALEALVAMREHEGQALGVAMGARLQTLEALLAQAQEGITAATARHVARWQAQLPLVAQASDAGPAAIALLLERLDVQEEVARLQSHHNQLRLAFKATEPVGRQLDFLAQEMLREWTTLAAKAGDPRVAALTVSARVAVEQLREQAQNIE